MQRNLARLDWAVGLGVIGSAVALVAILAPRTKLEALPSFASQTGLPCTACHVGGFGPQLTPTGRAFKIGGYTQGGGEGLQAHIPLSAMTIGSFTHTNGAVPDDQIATHFGNNNNFAWDAASVFVAGRATDFAGGFMQFTYSNISNAVHVDNSDVRPYTTMVTAFGNDLRLGLSINNNPTVQDPYNSTFAWGYPFVASSLAPTPAASPILVSAFANNAIGVTGYAWYNQHLYLEAGGYQTLGPTALAKFGEALTVGASQNIMPYVRAAYEWNWGNNAAWVGGLYMSSNVNPATGPFTSTGDFGQDFYADYAVDFGYQFLGTGKHIATIQGIYVYENENLNSSANQFNAANGTAVGSHYSLNQFRLNTSYWYENTYGFTFGWQKTWGPANPVLYPSPQFGGSDLTGSANSKPNSNAFILEADYVPFGKDTSWGRPWANLKLGLQYIIYTQFNGGSANYDGFGRNASGNNTLYMFAWLAF
ncbi:MAG TPA: hypothetical protein VFA03_15030 [Acetobacteraceae bacterium]|nr:hypothetical protein [Acetobacteraceae bacterium]